MLVSRVRDGLERGHPLAPEGAGGGNAIFRTDSAAQALFEEDTAHGDEAFGQRINYFRALLDHCHAAAQHVYDELEENGVSVEVVFQIERMKIRLARIELLLGAGASPGAVRAST